MDADQAKLENNTIFKTVTGSTSYGLDVEGSDIDIKGIVVPEPNEILTLSDEWGTVSYNDPDIEYHTLKKFLRLLSSQNPTILEMLFVNDEFVITETEWGQKLRNNRHLFLSSQCYNSFGGYAREQLTRIKNGLNRATEEDNKALLSHKLNKIVNKAPENYASITPDDIAIDTILMQDEKTDVRLNIAADDVSLSELNGVTNEMNTMLKNFNKVNNRNRKSEEKLYKHAMHLVRLLKMGIEVLQTGKLNVYRSGDREFLLAIRRGEMTWDDLFSYVDTLFAQLEEAKNETLLPDHIDNDKINDLYYEIMTDRFRKT